MDGDSPKSSTRCQAFRCERNLLPKHLSTARNIRELRSTPVGAQSVQAPPLLRDPAQSRRSTDRNTLRQAAFRNLRKGPSWHIRRWVERFSSATQPSATCGFAGAFCKPVSCWCAFATQNFVAVQRHVELAMKIGLRNDVELDCAARGKKNWSCKVAEWAIAIADSQSSNVQQRLALECAPGSVIVEGIQKLHIFGGWLKGLK